jgi:hypothetical protein
MFEGSQRRVGEVKRDAQDRLLVRASPLIGQIAGRAEGMEPATLELTIQLADVAFDG